jgi:hypothetical protein
MRNEYGNMLNASSAIAYAHGVLSNVDVMLLYG